MQTTLSPTSTPPCTARCGSASVRGGHHHERGSGLVQASSAHRLHGPLRAHGGGVPLATTTHSVRRLGASSTRAPRPIAPYLASEESRHACYARRSPLRARELEWMWRTGQRRWIPMRAL